MSRDTLADWRAGNGTRYHLIDGAGDPLCGRDGLSPAGADWVSTHEKDIPPIYMRCEACNIAPAVQR